MVFIASALSSCSYLLEIYKLPNVSVDKLNAYLVADINAPESLHRLAFNRRMESADPGALGSGHRYKQMSYYASHGHQGQNRSVSYCKQYLR